MLCSNPFIEIDGQVEKYVKVKNKIKAKTKEIRKPFPCGQCMNCRINQQRLWKNRILLEAKYSKYNYFITLTYNEKHLPTKIDKVTGEEIGMLIKSDLQKYLKRLRKAHEPHKLRYFAVGEYGTNSWRPHFHLALFSDTAVAEDIIKGKWGNKEEEYGYSYVGDISHGSASYIAGYLQKKATKEYYSQIGSRPPEFATMSKQQGGIGKLGIEKVADELLKTGLDFDKVIDKLKLGRSNLYLGRYLTRKLAEKLEIPEKEFVKKFWTLIHDYDEKFENMAVMEDHFKGARDSQIERSKLKKARRTI